MTWGLIRFIERVQRRMIHDPQSDDLDLTTEAIGRLIRIAVLITGGPIILQTPGFFGIRGITFGGLGGIAVTLPRKICYPIFLVV